MIKAITLALILGSATAASAASDQPSDQQPKKERKICRADQSSTSHMTKRICKTAAEWKQQDQGTAERTDLQTGFHK